MTGVLRIILAIASLTLTGVQAARADCIDQLTIDAARLHEFERLMKTVAGQCTPIGVPMTEHFDAVEARYHDTFAAADQGLQAWFASVTGSAVHVSALYDRYTRLIADRYGSGQATPDACRAFDAVAVAIARATDRGQTLASVAQAMIAHPVLEAAACPAKD